MTTGHIAAALKEKLQDSVVRQCRIGRQIPLKAN